MTERPVTHAELPIIFRSFHASSWRVCRMGRHDGVGMYVFERLSVLVPVLKISSFTDRDGPFKGLQLRWM